MIDCKLKNNKNSLFPNYAVPSLLYICVKTILGSPINLPRIVTLTNDVQTRVLSKGIDNIQDWLALRPYCHEVALQDAAFILLKKRKLIPLIDYFCFFNAEKSLLDCAFQESIRQCDSKELIIILERFALDVAEVNQKPSMSDFLVDKASSLFLSTSLQNLFKCAFYITTLTSTIFIKNLFDKFCKLSPVSPLQNHAASSSFHKMYKLVATIYDYRWCIWFAKFLLVPDPPKKTSSRTFFNLRKLAIQIFFLPEKVSDKLFKFFLNENLKLVDKIYTFTGFPSLIIVKKFPEVEFSEERNFLHRELNLIRNLWIKQMLKSK